MAYGERILRRDTQGDDVVELQLRLAGFWGTLPDSHVGPGTDLQVKAFQRDYMRLHAPTCIMDRATFQAIDEMAWRFAVINFDNADTYRFSKGEASHQRPAERSTCQLSQLTGIMTYMARQQRYWAAAKR